jgi:hypothetical protein
MQVYELSIKSGTVSDLDLPLRSVYLLAAPSTPQQVRDDVIAKASEGTLSHAERCAFR